jgi:sirohydrochlorin ferrochelatase
MNALLIVAHGSRRSQSNDEVAALADTIREKCSEEYPIVHAGFLELAEPSIPDGITNCINDGASHVTVLPYFLNSGRHVVEDVPEMLEQARSQHPDAEITLAQHLGASSMMIDLVISLAKSAS